MPVANSASARRRWRDSAIQLFTVLTISDFADCTRGSTAAGEMSASALSPRLIILTAALMAYQIRQ
jgi:hypothetical protein